MFARDPKRWHVGVVFPGAYVATMKIFISSLIAGFSREREAAKLGVNTLRHEPIMAEDFGALPTSPQIACLQGLRESDMVVLVLGSSYGAVQPGSGLSATHEEYREARQTKPVLAFVQQGVTPDPNRPLSSRRCRHGKEACFAVASTILQTCRRASSARFTIMPSPASLVRLIRTISPDAPRTSLPRRIGARFLARSLT